MKAKAQALQRGGPGGQPGGLVPRAQRAKQVQAVGALTAGLVAPVLGKQGAMLAQLAPHWGALCPLLAAYSVPETVRGGVLTVAVASASVQQELRYVAPQVLAGANQLLGYAGLHEVRGVVRPDVQARVQQRLPGMRAKKAAAPLGAGDELATVDALTTALARLQRAMKQGK